MAGSARSRPRRRRRAGGRRRCARARSGPPSSSIADLFAHRLLHDPRAGEEHPRLGGHHDEVGQRRRVGAAAGGDAADDRDLRDLARELDAGAEDAAVAGERRVALLQAGAAGADEADHRGAGVAGHAQHAGRSSRRGPRRACRRGRPGPGSSRRPAGRRPRRRRRRRRRRASPARPAAARRRRCAAAGSCPGRRAPRAARSGVSTAGAGTARCDGGGGHQAARQRTALWPPKPNELEMATSGPVPVLDRFRGSGHVVEVEALLGLFPAQRRRRHRGGAGRRPWRSPRPRRRRRAGGRSTTWSS